MRSIVVSLAAFGAPVDDAAQPEVGRASVYSGATDVLVPSPSIVVTPLITTPTGLTLSALWPAPFPSGVDLYFQFWIADPSGPAGFSASNAVRATTP